MARILVVDDDQVTVVALARLLQIDGHEVFSFTSGEEAIDALSRSRFDVVFTDLEMPVVDGRAVLRAARRIVPASCVVVATGRAVERGDELRREGACVVAGKPIDYDEILHALSACPAHERDGHRPIGRRSP